VAYQQNGSMAVESNGGFVVVWQSLVSGGNDIDSFSVQGQRYDASGGVIGTEFQINTYTTSAQSAPSAASDTDGNFAVAWHSDGSTGTDSSAESIQAKRFSGLPTPPAPTAQIVHSTSAPTGMSTPMI
jgi:hypothetical protein